MDDFFPLLNLSRVFIIIFSEGDNEAFFFVKATKFSFLLFHRDLTGGFLLFRNFSVAISVSPHVCFNLVLILISMFLR